MIIEVDNRSWVKKAIEEIRKIPSSPQCQFLSREKHVLFAGSGARKNH